LYRGDTGVNLVVLCGEKPTKSLLERMALSLPAQLTEVAPEEKYEVSRVTRSAADPGCLSRIPDLDFCLSRISDLLDPKTATKERGETKFVVLPFFVATNITKLKIVLFLNCCRKKFWAIYKESKNPLIPDPQTWLRGLRQFLEIVIIYVTGTGKQCCGSRFNKSESRSRILAEYRSVFGPRVF
jgi:hypothetical protein